MPKPRPRTVTLDQLATLVERRNRQKLDKALDEKAKPKEKQ